jgi:hypothetical protein
MKTYWHFCALDAEGRPVMRDGSIVEVGKRYNIGGVPELCDRGYHGSARAIDALDYAPGPWVSKRPLEGVIEGIDQVVGTAYTQQVGVDATEALWTFARLCAPHAMTWDAAKDTAWYTAGHAARIAAGDAAEDAVRYVTEDETWRAAWYAAWYAARDGQNRRLTSLLNKALHEASDD